MSDSTDFWPFDDALPGAAVADRDEIEQSMTVRLASAPEQAVAIARRALRQLLEGLDQASRDDVLLVTSELVTNALLANARTTLRVHLQPPTGCRIEVTDDDPRLPKEPRPEPVTGDGGRGLHIVETIAERWGVLLHDGGKTVWAELRFAPDATTD